LLLELPLEVHEGLPQVRDTFQYPLHVIQCNGTRPSGGDDLVVVVVIVVVVVRRGGGGVEGMVVVTCHNAWGK